MPTEATVRRERRWSAIWIAPLAALLVGIWIFTQSYLNQGPQVQITFATAEGLIAGETRVKRLAVDLGVVEAIRLNDDLESVTVVARLVPSATELLRTDSQFWVVRPRIGSQGISGLNTLLSGAYIELVPGSGNKGIRRFRGLDDIPVTPPSTPGLRLELVSGDAASISVGSPLLYNGYRVGRVESAALDPTDGETRYSAFIDAPYDGLVNTNTRFWDASGVAVSAGAAGFNVRTESLEALFTGGVAFGIPPGATPGVQVSDGAQFRLYQDETAVRRNPYEHTREYLLLFDSSVRGLYPDAPVEFRGLRIGTVKEVALDTREHPDGQGLVRGDGSNRIPVVIEIQAGWLDDDTDAAVAALADSLEAEIDNGLRASLAIGNLLTANLFVSFDFHDEAEPAAMTDQFGYRTFPTVASGLDQIEQKVASLLSKLQSLPLDETVDATTSAMRQMERAVGNANDAVMELTRLLGETREAELPANASAALAEAREVLLGLAPGSAVHRELTDALNQLKQTLSGAEAVLQTYDNHPNAVLFDPRRPADPVPRAGRTAEGGH